MHKNLNINADVVTEITEEITPHAKHGCFRQQVITTTIEETNTNET